VYYRVEFQWRTETYTGWVPSEYFSPPVERVSSKPGTSANHRLTYGYDAQDGWEYYHSGGAAQNLNLWKLFEEIGYVLPEGEADFTASHFNLCGQLAVMEALGIPLEIGFRTFADLGPSYRDILRNPDRGTYSDELREFIEATGTTVGVDNRERELDGELRSGAKIVALVTIDEGRVDAGGTTAHWVHVTQYQENSVTFYNPFSNEEETILTDEFKQAWSSTPDNEKRNVTMVVWP
jgi:hypothetical protein